MKIGDYEYTNDGFLGEGSYGKVYKGKSLKTQEEVAIKVMDRAKLNDPLLIESLKKEINVMKQLTSPHVVKMFDVYEDSKNTYIILELCNGGDLDKFIRSHGG